MLRYVIKQTAKVKAIHLWEKVWLTAAAVEKAMAKAEKQVQVKAAAPGMALLPSDQRRHPACWQGQIRLIRRICVVRA